MTTLAEALAPKSDQLNADDLIPGPRTIKITDVRITKADRQTRITLNFEGDNGKPFKPCKTMGRAMVMVWGITDPDGKDMIGKSITVYRDPSVKFGDQGEVGGIRISHMSHIDKPATVKLTVSQGKKSVFVFQPLVAEVRQIDKVADGVRQLLARIEAGEDVTAEHAVQKQREWLTKNRPELAAQVDAMLASVAADDPFAGPAHSQRGETHNLDVPDLIARIGKLVRVEDINALCGSWSDQIGELEPDARNAIAKAQRERNAEIKRDAANG